VFGECDGCVTESPEAWSEWDGDRAVPFGFAGKDPTPDEAGFDPVRGSRAERGIATQEELETGGGVTGREDTFELRIGDDACRSVWTVDVGDSGEAFRRAVDDGEPAPEAAVIPDTCTGPEVCPEFAASGDVGRGDKVGVFGTTCGDEVTGCSAMSAVFVSESRPPE
jgi:hypothetical protein